MVEVDIWWDRGAQGAVEDDKRSIYPALGVWWEGSRERFPLLRMKEAFLDEEISNTSPNDGGANKAQEEAVRLAWQKEQHERRKEEEQQHEVGKGEGLSNTGSLIFKKGLAAENSAWECEGWKGKEERCRQGTHTWHLSSISQSIVFTCIVSSAPWSSHVKFTGAMVVLSGSTSGPPNANPMQWFILHLYSALPILLNAVLPINHPLSTSRILLRAPWSLNSLSRQFVGLQDLIQVSLFVWSLPWDYHPSTVGFPSRYYSTCYTE